MSWYAAVIKSYIPDKHRARVEIFGLTDDTSGIYPEAEIAYAIGDSCNDTETLIKPGDAVWVTFGMCGDSRTPIIVALTKCAFRKHGRNQTNSAKKY